LATSVTVSTVPNGSDGLAHLPGGACAYQVARPVALDGGGDVVVVVVGGGGSLVVVVVVVGGGAVVVVVVVVGSVAVVNAGTWKASFRLGIVPISVRAEAAAAVRPPPALPGAALVSVAPVPSTRRGTNNSPRLSNEPTTRRLPPVLCVLRPPPFSGDMTSAPTRGPAQE
jgi:hypothetical protein